VVATDQDIAKIVTALHDDLKVEYIAPGHCTGEPAFAALKKTYGEHFLYAGVGSTLTTASLMQ
jgi:7,8-dihydropterin-6-yl-methyl-4-(beta-D-ribofuranosyl)aminobenzene 5'-phosphate synthase